MYLRCLLIAYFLICIASFATSNDNPSLVYIENKNQWEGDVFFSAQLPIGVIYLKNNSLHYFLRDQSRFNHLHENSGVDRLTENGEFSCEEIESVQNHYYNVSFVNGNLANQPKGKNKTTQYYNYFLGNDSSKWASNAYGYSEVFYENVYENIDFRIFSQSSSPKYDFIVKPEADLSQIKLKYEGVNDIYVFNNQLYIETSLGLVKEDVPLAYQVIEGVHRNIEVKYALDCDVLSFEIEGAYDTSKALIIDPLLIFSTYSGSPADNWGNTATPGENGKLYSGGITNHNRNNEYLGEFPASGGAYQTEWGGNWDIAIIKYDSTGSSMEYATYLGGSGSEVPHSIIMDNNEDLVIFGTTNSNDFPTTTNAYLNSFQGGSLHTTILGETFENGSDIFITKLSKDGSQLKASTYFGGDGNDGQNLTTSSLTRNYGDQQRGEVYVDEENSIFLSSVTNSMNLFDLVTNSFQRIYSGGKSDAILVKFKSDLSDIYYGGYLGGSNEDTGFAIRVNNSKQTYVAGGTSSNDFPVSEDAYQTLYTGAVDGWVALVDETGNNLLKASYTGTGSYDQVYLMDLDRDDNVYILGQSLENDFPKSSNVYSNTFGSIFIQKLNPDLSELLLSTSIGSNTNSDARISPTAFLVNDCNNLYLTGWGGNINANNRNSNDGSNYVEGNTLSMPVSPDAFQTTTGGSDFYFMVLSDDASEFLYGTYLGDNAALIHVDGGTSRFDKSGVVYHSVCASCDGSSTFPTTEGAWSRTNGANGGCNNAAFKFDLASLRARLRTNSLAFDDPGLRSICLPNPIVFENVSIGGEEFEWNFGDGYTESRTDTSHIVHHYINSGSYLVTLKAIDENTCIGVDITSTTINVFEGNFSVGNDRTICGGDEFKLEAYGGTSYYWYDKEVSFSSNDQFPTVQPEDSTTYYVFINDQIRGCNYLDSIKVSVLPVINADFSIERNYNCFDTPEVIIVNKSDNVSEYHWDFGDGTSSEEKDPVHTYDEGVYQLKLRGAYEFCIDEKIIEINTNPITAYNVITPTTTMGINDYFVIDSPFPIHITIVNRWGKVVHEAEEYKNDWNAKGEPAGVYFYDLKVNGEQECKGWVQVFK